MHHYVCYRISGVVQNYESIHRDDKTNLLFHCHPILMRPFCKKLKK